MPRFLEPVSDKDMQAELWNRIQRAMNNVDNELSNKRIEILKYYRGEPFGNEQEGYSKARTRQSFETVEWMLTQIIRAFFAGCSPVEFVPEGYEDEEMAAQDTDVVFNIIKRNEFYETIETWFRDALINPNGYIKVWWENYGEYTPPALYTGQTPAQLMMMMQDENVFVEEYEMQNDGLLSIVIRCIERRGKICMMAVPPEEVLVDNDATSTDLDQAAMVCHHRQVPRTELVRLGYDPQLVATIPRSNQLRYSTEREKRRKTEDEQDYLRNNGATEEVDVFDVYIRFDQDGDGIAEPRKVVMAGTTGNTVFLENEEDDYIPLIGISTICQPHRHVGESAVQMSMQNELIQSTLARQMLDNLYRTNRPRTFAGSGVNIDQLMTYVPHGVVECNDPRMISTEATQPVTQQIMPAFEYFERRLEATTGVNRQAQGLDAKTLSQTPMSSFLEAKSDSSSRIELIIRNWAETGMRKLFCKIHRLMRQNQDIPRTMRIRGRWIDVDPTSWKNRADTRALVGLGTGTPEERISAGLSLLEIQKEAMAYGLTDATKVYKNLDDICKAMGKTGADAYFHNPNTPEGRQSLQRAQQAKQEAQAKQEQFLEMGLMLDANDKHKKRMLEAGELERKIEKDAKDHAEEMTKLELVHDADVPGSTV